MLATDLAPRESYVPILVEALEMARGEPRIHAADVVSVLSDLASPESREVIASLVNDDRAEVRELARDAVDNPGQSW